MLLYYTLCDSWQEVIGQLKGMILIYNLTKSITITGLYIYFCILSWFCWIFVKQVYTGKLRALSSDQTKATMFKPRISRSWSSDLRTFDLPCWHRNLCIHISAQKNTQTCSECFARPCRRAYLIAAKSKQNILFLAIQYKYSKLLF